MPGLRKHALYETSVWPRWYSQIDRRAPIVLLPGIMGSELYDDERDGAGNGTVWVDGGIFHEVDNLEVAQLSPDGLLDSQRQSIYARSTVNPPVLGEHYGPFQRGVSRGRFCYDWRESMSIEARRLGLFLASLPQGTPPLTLVTHSMGGPVLLSLLVETTDFDKRIARIVFCAPPFHGALAPVRVIEDGDGTPADWLIANSALRQSAATMPGLFQLLPAPPDLWPTVVPGVNGRLHYPVRGQVTDLYSASSWSNRHRPDLRVPILDFARERYRRVLAGAPAVVQRFDGRITVIVGINGKTDYAAQRVDGHWVLHTAPAPLTGRRSNGDGTVMLQSSLLPGLALEHYWAYVPPARGDTHGDLVNIPEVMRAIREIAAGGAPSGQGLEQGPGFMRTIDFSREVAGGRRPAAAPRPTANLDYHERARARLRLGPEAWLPGKKLEAALNPGGVDAAVFDATRAAALRVLHGADMAAEASRIGQTPEFLRNHLKSLLMPAMFG